MWGYFGGSTTKIPPHTLSTTEIPKDPFFLLRQTARHVTGVQAKNGKNNVSHPKIILFQH